MPSYQTKQRKALLGFLQAHADEALTADQIADALSAEGVSRSAVYRNLAALAAEGAVQRVSRSGTRRLFYRYTGAEACRAHLHLSCSSCGRTFHVDVPATNTIIERIRRDADFRIDSSSTVLYGVCADCRKE